MPTKQEAQALYRSVWQQYLLTSDREERQRLGELMDRYQPFCVDDGKPGPEWNAFAASLPGYLEHWEGLKEECEKMIEDMERRAKSSS